jgi:GT2 family glycosyltransferase
VAFAPAGAVLAPHALAQLAAALDAYPEAALAYADLTLTAPDGAEWPVALPAFDYELLLEQGSGALFFAARTDYVHAAAAAGASDLFRLFLHGQDRRRPAVAPACGSDPATPVHQPGFLARLPALDLAGLSGQLGDAVAAHLEARGARARLVRGRGSALPSVRVTRAAPAGKVSIVIPTRQDGDRLKICCASLARTVDLARHELIVIDNDSAEVGKLALLDQLSARGVRIQRAGGPWNFPRLVEAGASVAGGEFLLVLDPSVEAREEGWLEEMLGRMAEPDVGAVGPVLVRPNGLVAQGGHMLGPGFAAAPAFQDRLESDPGYADRLRAAHEVSAVSAACLLTERRLFLSVGGFDGALFPHHCHDVDYGLKLRARGARVVLTPHARLLQREKTTYAPPESRALETSRLRAAWGDALAADPAYHPLLSLDGPPFSALAWPPRPTDPRQPFWAPARAVPPGF